MTRATALALTRRRPDDAGSVAVELTLLTPLLVALLLFVVAAGRVTTARIAVQDAATRAARALTLHPAVQPDGGVEQARAAALTATTDLGCRTLTVHLTPFGREAPAGRGLQGATPGRVVTVQVACTVDLGDLTGLGLPGSTVIPATATSPLDRYRSAP